MALTAIHFSHPLVKAVPVTLADRNTFSVRVQGGRITSTANGTPVETGFAPPNGLAGGRALLVGLGGYVDENVVELRFRDVVVRRLAAGS